ncbi:MAG: TIGR03936 family radical SAM-associated protein [Spirochaetaceae bacterium]|jgi:hypothetical protein|nr:TIGR03936 family radical SAM-associated protein [Spirochaetaceae bacterium]
MLCLKNNELEAGTHRILFSYSKKGKAALLSHLSLIDVFSRALLAARLPVAWTEGFNPMPKLDYAAPLAIGIAARAEIALTDMQHYVEKSEFISAINKKLPEGVFAEDALCFTVPHGVKKYSAAALLWGFEYETEGGTDCIPAKEDKHYREQRFPDGGIWGLTRRAVLAALPAAPPRPYFELFSELYDLTPSLQNLTPANK